MTIGLVTVATGMRVEARIAGRKPGALVVVGGGDKEHLAREIEHSIARGARGVLSFGIAGGLAPGLEPGSVIIARDVWHDGHVYPADEDWAHRIAGQLLEFRVARLAGSDVPVSTAPAKAELHAATAAVAVDMESHVAARIAARHHLPFAAVRVVADHAHRELPPAAVAGFGPGGSVNIPAVLKALALKPSQLPQLLRVSRDTQAAFAALSRSHRRVAAVPAFGLVVKKSAAAEPELEPV